mmetsp:Transcript_116583/g.267601  ORF Transcript_116583/g.267601 Transcript_116583/m.267601 type:complete len:118 (-) Transcript_116583:149-502(-)
MACVRMQSLPELSAVDLDLPRGVGVRWQEGLEIQRSCSLRRRRSTEELRASRGGRQGCNPSRVFAPERSRGKKRSEQLLLWKILVRHVRRDVRRIRKYGRSYVILFALFALMLRWKR